MAKKEKKLKKKLLHKYRLVVLNEDTFEERYAIKLNRLNVFVLTALSAATNPIELFASINDIEFDIFLILIFGFGLMTFFLILSQYILSLDMP